MAWVIARMWSSLKDALVEAPRCTSTEADLMGGRGGIGLDVVVGVFQSGQINEHSARGGRTGEGVQGHKDIIDSQELGRTGRSGV